MSLTYGKLRKTADRKARLAMKAKEAQEAEELEAKGFVITQVLRPDDKVVPMIRHTKFPDTYMDEEQEAFKNDSAEELQVLFHAQDGQFLFPWEEAEAATHNKKRIEKHFKMLQDL